MNSAELEFWGGVETMRGYLRSVRRPGEELDGFDDRPSTDEAIVYAECLGEAGETLLAELMKMKRAAEAEPVTAAAALELAAV